VTSARETDDTAVRNTEPMTAERRNEWLLVVFTGTTNLADAVTKVALPLLAVRLTKSPALVSGVAIALTLPWLLTALHVGVLVDRRNRRSLMVAAEATRLASVAILLVAVLAHLETLPLIYVFALVLGVAEVVALVSGASIVPSIVPRHRWQTASSRITAAEYLCNAFLGAPVGGFLVAAGFTIALGVTGLVYLGGAVLLMMMVGNFSVQRVEEHRSVRADSRDGLRFLWQHQLLRGMSFLIMGMAACWAAWLALIPVYAVGQLDLNAKQYGLLLTCLGAGGVLGTVVAGRTNRLLGRRWSMFIDIIGSFALVAAPAVLPASASSAWPIGVAAFVAGAGGTMWTVNARVITQSFVPEHMLGRFNSASRLISWGTMPVAAAVAGALAQLLGYRVAFGFFAVLCAMLVIPFLRVVTDRAIAPVDQPAEPGVIVS
jgi:MFS family permease